MVIIRIWEGLGNQLFQYAYAKALSLRTGQKVYLDTSEYSHKVLRKYGLGNFKISLPAVPAGKPVFDYVDSHDLYQIISDDAGELECGAPVRFGKEETFFYKRKLMKPRGNWYLKGLFQDERYFAQYADVIRKEIDLKEKPEVPADLQNILSNRETVAVHLRRGDYKKLRLDLSVAYYGRAKAQIESRIGNPFYLIFSDDIAWAKQNLDFGENSYFVNCDRKLRDCDELYLMSRCKHIIMANSTFSWWGAWLNGNKEKCVVAPEVWDRRNPYFRPGHILPEWITV